MERPNVDVVVPFAGAAADLDGLLDRLSLLRLGDGDSVVVADNRPSPGERPGAAAGRARVIEAAGPATPAFARNRGAEPGSAEWLLFIDADVEPPPDLLDRYFERPPAERTAVLAGGVLDEAQAAGERQSVAQRYAHLREPTSHDRSLDRGRWSYANTTNCAVRRAAFESVGGFDESARAAEDADLCYRLRDRGWQNERRDGAAVVHRSRRTVREYLGRLLVHAAGAAWLDGKYPGASPSRRGLGLVAWALRRLGGGALALARGNRDEATLGLMDAVGIWTWEIGRLLPNTPREPEAARSRASGGEWFTEHSLDAPVSAADVWDRCYADAARWPEWNSQIASVRLEGPFELGSVARVRFTTGLRMRFGLVEVERERAFTDEAQLPLARMGHRHLIEPTEDGVRLTNRIYIRGPLAPLWARLLGPRAAAELPEAQRRIVEIAER